METLIPVVAKITDVLGALGQSTKLDLPQIVVVGGQSSGKSSVLEGLVGRSFLPRGHGIVTRRPLILQLIQIATSKSKISKNNDEMEITNGLLKEKGYDGSADGEEWGEFLHLPGKKFYDFDLIRMEIIKDTERITGSNKGISPSPINLKIFSPNVLHLTLVDLPGIAKVAVGDQPPDIEEQIRQMCLQYIGNPNAIILAVSAGNTDLANSDAIQLAKCVDRSGERTLGVITKLDLLDPGTDARDYLLNRVIPLQKGYIGIMNRGQRDIDNNVSIQDGLRKETQFFNTHPSYRDIQEKCGTQNLAKSLNSILMHHIRDCLPALKSKITAMIHELNLELESLGSPNSPQTLSGTLLTLLSKFTTNFSSCLAGQGLPKSNTNNNTLGMDLYGGARISFIFHQVFVRSLLNIEPFDSLSDEEIRVTIANANGTRSSLFVPEQSFDVLVKKQISRLEQPGVQCVDLIFDELMKMVVQCEPPEFIRYPVLREKLVEVINELLRKSVAPTQMMVSHLIKIELAYINTSHPDFIGGGKAVAQLMQDVGKKDENTDDGESDPEFNDTYENEVEQKFATSKEEGGLMNFIFPSKGNNDKHQQKTNGDLPTLIQLPQVPLNIPSSQTNDSARDKIETRIIKSLISSYFSIVRKNYIDMVPKTIMYFLVNHVRDAMHNELVQKLYSGGQIEDVMKEAEDVEKRRSTCIEMKDLLGKALSIVNEVRDFRNF